MFVFVDSGGSFNNDTECVNGPRGNVADHLTKDVVPYVNQQFGTSADPANWGIVGWSMGGTCAVDLTVMHPELFSSFVDIAGDMGPNAGTKDQTIARLYGGERRDVGAVRPDHRDRPNTARTRAFRAGSRSPPTRRRSTRAGGGGDDAVGLGGRDAAGNPGDQTEAANSLCTLGRANGIACAVVPTTGRHDWPLATNVFTAALPWLAGPIGTPGVPKIPLPGEGGGPGRRAPRCRLQALRSRASAASRIMDRMTDGPLIVQSDKTVLLEVDHELAGAARAAIAPFAELERAPEHIHTYRITPLALWNARAAGHDAEQVVDALVSFSRYSVPQPLLVDIVDTMARYGRLQLVKSPVHGLLLVSLDRAVLEEVMRNKKIAPMLGARIDDDTVIVHASERGRVKQMLLKIGWPAEDLAGYVDGEAHPISLAQDGWELRDYQEMAADSFWAGGSGVVVLPCGAGKTLVGAAAMAKAGATTLILVTNTVAGRQWKRELIARTSLTEEEIGEYSGETQGDPPRHHRHVPGDHPPYQGRVPHLELFDSRDWGLIIYDEVHLLPAPVFRMTADLQSRRRLGLTATLIREDGREGDVFSLIGPKRYDAPWKDIEAQGWIAPAECIEVRVTMTENERMLYATAEPEERYKLCSTAHTKVAVVKSILDEAPR